MVSNSRRSEKDTSSVNTPRPTINKYGIGGKLVASAKDHRYPAIRGPIALARDANDCPKPFTTPKFSVVVELLTRTIMSVKAMAECTCLITMDRKRMVHTISTT